MRTSPRSHRVSEVGDPAGNVDVPTGDEPRLLLHDEEHGVRDVVNLAQPVRRPRPPDHVLRQRLAPGAAPELDLLVCDHGAGRHRVHRDAVATAEL